MLSYLNSSSIAMYRSLLFVLMLLHPLIGRADNNFLLDIDAPRRIPLPKIRQPFVVAIVDDGLDTTREALRPYLYQNSREEPNNSIDDDANGFADDVSGWDLSDKDNDIRPPSSRKSEYYHGTKVASVLVAIFQRAYGERAHHYIKILPVKVLSDHATRPYLQSGYEGIKYALDQGASVIVTAWSMPGLKDEESSILQEAHKKDVPIVASAGNFSTEEEYYPASFPSVLGVGAVGEDNEKLPESNYGHFVTLAAPGYDIPLKLLSGSKDSLLPPNNLKFQGTSVATAIVAAAVTLTKLNHPTWSSGYLRAALEVTARPLDHGENPFNSRVGAGVVQISKAIKWNPESPQQEIERRPRGTLVFNRSEPRARLLDISTPHDGIELTIRDIVPARTSEHVSIFHKNGTTETLFGTYSLKKFPSPLQVPFQKILLRYEGPKDDSYRPVLISYRTLLTKIGSKYCTGTEVIEQETFISDGSNSTSYEPQTDCKWLIVAPPGKQIEVAFEEFDTQPKLDLIYFFHGRGTHEKILGIYSGHELPPIMRSWGSEMLLWFVTDRTSQYGGWRARVQFVEPTKTR